MTILNDIHSRLNPTRVARVVRPGSLDTLCHEILCARRDGLPVCISGGRHAMGGQQFGSGTVAIDTAALDRVIAFDPGSGTVEVEAGIHWPALVDALHKLQGAQPYWGIAQKQTGADRLSIGGALSANIHGRGLTMRPIVQDIESFTLIDANGELRQCSRTSEPELFALTIGGYGLVGAIATVTLRLVRRRKLERLVKVIYSDDLTEAFAARIAEGCVYGDFQFRTDAISEDFLSEGVFTCYRPVPDDTPISVGHVELNEIDWRRLYRLAHVDRTELFAVYSDFYRSTHGQIYWSDLHQLSVYIDGYHEQLDSELGFSVPHSEMITELYVPRTELGGFLAAMASEFRRHGVAPIYGTVRLVDAERETVLAWARDSWACVIVNLCVPHDPSGIALARSTFCRLIDLARERHGSYYLTYHRWASKDQVEACHPHLRMFLLRKRHYDPSEVFQSDWYRHHCALLDDPPIT